MILMYLQKLKNRLVALMNGVTLHAADWAGQAETPATIQANIDQIDAMQADINDLDDQLSQKRKEGRTLETELTLIADTIENKAIGFHTTNPEVLVDYDIELRKTPEKRPVPTAVLVPVLEDDVDGEGFIISCEVDPDADKYEWEKGTAEDPTDTTTVPTMQHFKITSKTKFVDDNVMPGKRYFYRLRAFNTTGNGPWSAAVSRVQ